jgi:hemoglobin-like flavoprotein
MRRTMLPEQLDLVETSFAVFYPSALEAFAIHFYEQLFALDPSLRARFPSDMREQRLKLMTTLNIAVNGLRHPISLAPILADLGRLHARLGVGGAHYQIMGAALHATLQQYLGARYTPAIADAWTAAYTAITSMMEAELAEPVIA